MRGNSDLEGVIRYIIWELETYMKRYGNEFWLAAGVKFELWRLFIAIIRPEFQGYG